MGCSSTSASTGWKTVCWKRESSSRSAEVRLLRVRGRVRVG